MAAPRSSDRKTECPYQGLYAFRERDSPYFFGRRAYSVRLWQRVQREPLVALLGASGSGKSSLAFAGLLPRVRNAGWQTVTFRPESDPFRSLAAALLPLLEPEMTRVDRLAQTSKLSDALCKGELPLMDVVRAILEQTASDRFLLLGDQFEELYTLCTDSGTRQAFLDLLLGAVMAAPSGFLLLTMRADFLSQALEYRPFADIVQNRQVVLGPMNREELQRAIEEPAALYNVTFEPGLVARILDDVEVAPGSLPLLEFALTEMWKRQAPRQGDDAPALSPQLYNDLRSTLLTCGPFDDNAELRHIFADPRLRPWRDRAPQTEDIGRRVEATIALLQDRQNNDGVAALSLLLAVLHDRLDAEDACRTRLSELAARLDNQPGRPVGGLLTHDAYEAIGGVEGALARHADEVYSTLGHDEKRQTRRLFVQLVQPGAGTEDTRRRAARQELGDVPWELVAQLAGYRLVVTGQDATGEERVEITHETLIQRWGRLQKWMDQARTFRAWQERLRAAMRQWQATGEDEEALLRGTALAEAEGWLERATQWLGATEKKFIAASQAEAAARAEAEEEARRSLDFYFIARWVLVTTIGFALGGLLVSLLPDGAVPAVPNLDMDLLAKGAILGACTGLLQRVLLRQRLGRFSEWVYVTVIGYVAGFALLMLVAVSPFTTGRVGLGLGATVGLLQSLALRRKLERTSTWLLTTTLGFTVATPLLVYILRLPGSAPRLTPFDLIEGAVSGAAAGIVVGLFSGAFLPRLLRQYQPPDSDTEKVATSVFMRLWIALAHHVGRINWLKRVVGLRRTTAWEGLSFVIIAVIVALWAYQHISAAGRSRTLSLEIGDVAQTAVVAPHTLVYVSEVLTEQARKQAIDSVDNVYAPRDESVAGAQVQQARSLFQAIDVVRSSGDRLEAKIERLTVLEGAKIEPVIAALLLSLDDNDYATVREDIERIVAEVMSGTIRDEPQAIEQATQQAATSYSFNLDAAQQEISIQLAPQLIVANTFVDQEATSVKKKVAAAAVAPVERTIYEGQHIVTANQEVTAVEQEAFEKFDLPGTEQAAPNAMRQIAPAALLVLGLLFTGLTFSRPFIVQRLQDRLPNRTSRSPWIWELALLSLLLLLITIGPLQRAFSGQAEALTPGATAPRDFIAPFSLNYISESETEAAREQAAAAVANVYTAPDLTVGREQVAEIQQFLQAVALIRDDVQINVTKKLAQLQAMEDVTLDEEIAGAILDLSSDEFEALLTEVPAVVQSAMRQPIRDEAQALSAAQEAARNRLNPALSPLQRQVARVLVPAFIVPNSFYNEEATERAQQEARASVNPVPVTYIQGQPIIRAGNTLTDRELEALERLGLWTSDSVTREPLLAATVGAVLLGLWWFLGIPNPATSAPSPLRQPEPHAVHSD